MPDHSPAFKSAAAQARFLSVYDAAMERWPVPCEVLDIATGYGRTHVIVSGPADAPPVVLLHCALMTSAIWSPIIGDLSRELRTYAVDVIGDIGRTVPTNPPETEADFAHWLTEVYRQLGLDHAGMLAWSYGGFVGTNFALREPESVDKLALLAPFATFARPGPGFLIGFLPMVIPTRRTAGYFERRMCFRGDFGHKEHSGIFYEQFRSGKLQLKVRPRVFTDLEFRWATMPTLLLVGKQELLYDASAAVERARTVLPRGEAEMLEDCNHAIVSDQTSQVSARVLEFLRS